MDEDTRKAVTFMAIKASIFILAPALAAVVAILVLL